MRKIILALLLVSTAGVAFRAEDDVRNRVIQSVFQVEWYTNRGEIATGGNGFIVCGSDGEPLAGVTAYHVATNESWQPLKMLQVKQYGVPIGIEEVFYHDSETDVALFRAPSRARDCLRFAELVTERVTFFGSIPVAIEVGRHEELLWSIPYWGLWGEITACCQNLNVLVREYIGDRWRKMVIGNLIFAYGHSGSPVVYENGTLAGMAVGMFSRTNGAIIVPASEIQVAIRRAGLGNQHAEQSAPAKAKAKKFEAPYFALPKLNYDG
ncbi:MAG: trypsin-like peptidase domain-containing protein [Candidatus Bathyarchaeia archaeon]